MEGVIALLTQAIAGAAGGNIVGQLAKSFSLGTLGNTVAGLAGGTGGAAILGMIVAPDGVLNPVMQNLIGGVFGGAALTMIAGLIKSMMGGKAQ